MTARLLLAREAATAALRLRAQLKRGFDGPVCPYGVAEELGIQVRFEPLASLEGMYSPEGPTIILGSMRPRGRRAFNCAHEVGHHVFGHGFRIDELLAQDLSEDRVDPAEYSANRFATALLMPKVAVERAFAERAWHMGSCTPAQVYTVACTFGVGYTTLIGCMERVLCTVSATHARNLRRHTPKTLRRQLLGVNVDGSLVVVDEHWGPQPVDIEVGDLVLPPPGAICSGTSVQRELVGDTACIRGVAPGIAHVASSCWRGTVRVSKRHYRGLCVYRHSEDPDYET